jgi:peptide/nickel transport system substrate-binding protein
MKKRMTWARAIALLMALGLVAAACGDDGGSSSNASGSSGSTASGSTGTGATAATTTLAPQKGGSITVSMFSETRGLDPAASSGSGTAGGTELSQIYDTIVRWNPDARSYDMRTAESVTSNATASEWTIKLKSGIKFRDGSAYDAEAVRYNFERNMTTVNTSTSRAWLNYVVGTSANVTVVDPLTVKVVLKVPDAGFQALLAHSPGMIVSPTAIKALGDPTAADYKSKYDAFNLKPTGAGAGPFEVDSFTKGESLVLKKSTSWYGGEAYLDSIKFVVLSGDKGVDGMKTGTVNVAFLRTPVSVANSKSDKTLGGFDNVIQAGDMLLVNQGIKLTCAAGKPAPLCTGQPDGTITTKPATANALVRAAVAAAIDPAVINTRVNDGKALPTTALFQKDFTDSPGVDGPKADPANAKKLLDQAKAAGFDGKIRVLCTNQPERVALAQTLETQLKAVGFDVTARSDLDTASQITEIITNKDYDIACWGLSVPNDETAPLSLVQNFWSASPNNRVGYSNPAWDAGLNVLLGAKDATSRKAAYKTMADLWNTDVPSVVFNAVIERIAFQNKVHGVYANESSMFFLDKAWIEH